jgi:hypothetical protein
MSSTSMPAPPTARELANRLNGKVRRVVVLDNGLQVHWKRPPSKSLEADLKSLSAEMWCLYAEGWRADADQCPTCGCPLVKTEVAARQYLECLSPLHYSQDITIGPHSTK